MVFLNRGELESKMAFGTDIFAKYRLIAGKLPEAGFVRSGGVWIARGELLFGKFLAELRLEEGKAPRVTVFDPDGVEYTLVHVESADGEYVNRVRESCRAFLLALRAKCFSEKRFFGGQAERLAATLAERYGEEPDDPWNGKYPGIGVFRRHGGRKWYAIVMNLDGAQLGRPGARCDVLVFRAGENRVAELLKTSGFFPAYHMNRKSWVSVVLDGTLRDDAILAELAAARDLLGPGSKPSAPDVWLVPANPKFYDVVGAFEKDECIIWKQSTAIRAGDTVYLYVGAPYSAILYGCRVEETGIPFEYADENVRMDRVMKIRRLHKFSPDEFPFPVLKKYGVNAVRGPRRMPERLDAALRRKMS